MANSLTFPPNDLTLMAAVARRDDYAFGQLYTRFVGRLFALVERIVDCPTEAEDIIQDTFRAVWERGGEYRPESGSPFAWAAAIARYKAIDRRRAVSRREERGPADGEGRIFPDPVSTVVASESSRAVRAAMHTLVPDERCVIGLAFFDGLTHQEISGALALPIGTVKARIRRGMRKLRPALAGFVDCPRPPPASLPCPAATIVTRKTPSCLSSIR